MAPVHPTSAPTSTFRKIRPNILRRRLHDLIRNPSAVRTWPAQTMLPFPPDHLSDDEIGLVFAYLKHMADRKQPQ